MHEPAPSRIRLILILGALAAFGPLATDMYLPAFPALTRALATDAAGVQGTLATYFIGLGAGQAVWGPISDRYGRKLPLLFGIALFVSASVACALATSIESLWLFRFIQALGGCVGMVLGRAIVRDLYMGADAAHFFSRLLIVFGMAPVIGPFFGSQTLVLFGWRAIFWVLASFGTACLIAVALRLPETLPQARRASGGIGTALQAYAKLLRDRHYLGFTAQSNFAFAGMFAYIAGSPFVFIELFGVSPQNFGLLFGLNAVGIVIASQVNAWLVHRFGPARMLRIGLLIYLAAALALLAGAVTAAGLAAIAAPLFLCVSMMGVVTPNSMALALEPYPHAAGSASALSGTLQFSVGAPIVALLGILHDGSALPMAYVVATCALVAMAINLMTRHRGALDARG